MGMDVQDLLLTKDDEEIGENNYSPSNDDMLMITPPIVTVNIVDDDDLIVPAMPTTTISDIKEYLAEDMEVDKLQLNLFSLDDDGGQEMSDTLRITKDMTLRLEVITQDEDSEEHTVGSEDDFEVASDDSEDDKATSNRQDHKGKTTARASRKKERATKPKSAKPDMEIHVQDSKGRSKASLTLQPEMTVRALKYEIEDTSDAKTIENSCLIFRGKELDDDKTLEECGVGVGDFLTTAVFAISIQHELFGGAVVPFDDIRRTDTIGTLKVNLAKNQSIPKHKQKLTIRGKSTPLDTEKTLQDYDIKCGSILVLQEKGGVERTANARAGKTDDGDDKNLDDKIAKIKARGAARKNANKKAGR
jgi:hypothetical protein